MKRIMIVCALIVGASLTHAAYLSQGGCTHQQTAAFSTCEHTALTQTITIAGVTETIENAVANALSTGNTETGIVAGLVTIASALGPLALDTIECALNMIDGANPSPPGDAGVTPAVAGTLTIHQRIAIGRAWLAQQRAAQAKAKG